MKALMVGVAAALLAAGTAQADLGGQMTYGGGAITVEFRGQTAGYDSELYYYPDYPALTNAQFLFHNHINAVGDTAVLAIPGGTPLGSELVFGIQVLNTGEVFFAGPGARNADNTIHNFVTTIDFANSIYDVGFEDLTNGGDFDYDDNVFRFYGAVPTPGAASLLAIGAVGALRRRRRA